MSMLVKYNKNLIIKTRINGIIFFFYKEELKAFYEPARNRFYIEEADMRKKSLMEALEDTYEFQHRGATIVGCYSLNNLVCNIKYVTDDKF